MVTLPKLLRPVCSHLSNACLLVVAAVGGLCAVLGLLAPDAALGWLWFGGPAALRDVLLVALAAGLVVVALGHGGRGLRRGCAMAALGLGALASMDTWAFFAAQAEGRIQSAAPVPLSLLLAAVFVHGGARLWGPGRPSSPRGTLIALGLAAPLLILGHLFALGATDYRRPADAAIVFGAAVRLDGSPSTALLDRTTTACDLYAEGLVDTLVFSGGRDPRAPRSEPACMAEIARSRGIPASAIVLDETGLTTRTSLDETRRLADAHGWRNLLMVSHDYHLARIQVAAHRRGLRSFGVPATESGSGTWKRTHVLREVAGFGYYLLTDL